MNYVSMGGPFMLNDHCDPAAGHILSTYAGPNCPCSNDSADLEPARRLPILHIAFMCNVSVTKGMQIMASSFCETEKILRKHLELIFNILYIQYT